MADRIRVSAALRVAKKKLPFTPDRELRQNLEWAADNKADAYRIGAEEAQHEIVRRLQELGRAEGTT